MIELLKNWLGDKNVILFGAGQVGMNVIENWPFNNNIVGIIDNREEKQKKLLNSKPVFNVDKLNKVNLLNIKIIITTNDSYSKTASDQLIKLGLLEGKDFINGKGLDKLLINFEGSKEDPYEQVIPKANYAPWREDQCFMELFNKICDNTLVDIYRCYEIWDIVKQVSKLKEGALIEIGVWRGGTGALICKQAEKNEIKDKVYLCDTFNGVVKASENDIIYKGGEHKDTSIEIVKELLTSLNLSNYKILKGVFPEQTSQFIKDTKFRFCHIDVDVYFSAKGIVDYIWDKMVIGGAIVYDDYGFKECNGITKFVNDQKRYDDRLIIHNINGHAIVIKIK